MLRSSGLWGMMAAGVVLLWSPVAIAQSLRSPNECPTTNAASQPGNSTVTSSLICDSSGEICIVTGSRRTGPPPAAVSAPSAGPCAPASSASGAATSPSPGATPESQPPKQQLFATAPRALICDTSGKICAPVGAGAYDNSAGLVTENPSDWVVDAYKSQHRLEVYFKSHLYRTYHAVFGRSLAAGAKLWSGDRRTPEGNYLIISKHRSARFGWFLHINYPNEQDHERFEQSRAAHLIPASANEGGQIGIHGTDSPYLNIADIDWTTGCISVDNADISELAQLLPVGALVIINP
jgi:lipoprotein-anchoring transpeptidase ErfK/SrfK